MSTVRIIVSKKRGVWRAAVIGAAFSATGDTRAKAIETLRRQVAHHFQAKGIEEVEDMPLNLDAMYTEARVEIWHVVVAEAKKVLGRGDLASAEKLAAQAEKMKAAVEKDGRKDNPNPFIANWYREFGGDEGTRAGGR